MSEQSAAKLYELMMKQGIKPAYEIIKSKTGTHENTFTMRVTCHIVSKALVWTAEGSGKSKKEAKQQAAFAFLHKYKLGDTNNNPAPVGVRTVKSTLTCAVNITDNNRINVLQALCMKNNFGMPEFEVVEMAGPPHSRRFTTRCRVTDLSTDGWGSTKAESKLDATTKMIQVLMQEAEVYEIFQTPQISATVASNEIICFTDNLKGPQQLVPMGIFGRRSSSSSSCDSYPASGTCNGNLSRAGRLIDLKTTVDRSFDNNNCKKAEIFAESSDASDSDVSLIDLDDNCQHAKAGILKTKSKSLNNLSDLSESDKNLAIKKIEATLESVEKQLYNEILDTLENRDLPRQKTVVILHHEYEIFISIGSPLKIFEGDEKCTDPSIRIATLAKLLMDLKDHVKSNRVKFQ